MTGWQVPSPVASAALSQPERPGLVTHNSLSWREIRRQVALRAGAFADQGVDPGAVVALLAPRDAAWVIDAHAIGWLGATLAPINADQPATAVRDTFGLLKPTFQVIRGALADADDLPGQRLEAVANPRPAPERAWPMDEGRVLLLTSGTQGSPKAVLLRTGQLLFSAFGSAIALGHLPGDRWLNCLPLHHVGGLALLYRAAFYGTTVELAPRFDPAQVARRLRSGEVHGVSLTPRMLADVLAEGPQRPMPKALRVILVGGAAMSAELLRSARDLKLPVARTWGMTEAASQVCTAGPGDLDQPGLPPLAFARVSAPDGRLAVAGPLVDGECATSDAGEIDASGRVTVLGRADDVIVSGGAKTMPGVVEAALCGHPGVTEAAVVGRADARWGAMPVAFVVCSDAAVTAEQLRQWCRARLPNYSVPRAVLMRDRLPRDPLGKLLRRELRRQAEAGHGGEELGGHAPGLEFGQLDEGVAQADAAAQVISVLPMNIIDKCDRSRADAVQPGGDDQPLGHAHGAVVAGLGMNEGHPEAQTVKDHIEVAQGGGDELLKAGVGVLEGAPEEDDSGPVHVVEAGRQAVLEGHSDSLQEVLR